MKCIGIEHGDDGILKPVIMDLEPGDLHSLSNGELCALDFDMHAMMTKNQAQDFIVKLQALIKDSNIMDFCKGVHELEFTNPRSTKMEDWSLEIYEVEYLEFDEVVVME